MMAARDPHDLLVLRAIGALTASGATIDTYAVRLETALNANELHAALRRLRWQGRVEFDRLELSPSEQRWARRVVPATAAEPAEEPVAVAIVEIPPQVELREANAVPTRPVPPRRGYKAWVEDYVARVRDARKYLDSRGFGVSRASSSDATWTIVGRAGVFTNEQLVAFADEQRAVTA